MKEERVAESVFVALKHWPSDSDSVFVFSTRKAANKFCEWNKYLYAEVTVVDNVICPTCGASAQPALAGEKE